MVLIASIYIFTSTIFKNAIPAIPVLILYMIFSNLGSVGDDGIYGYHLKPMSLYVRFANLFYENKITKYIIFNQSGLIILSVALVSATVVLWNKRRM